MSSYPSNMETITPLKLHPLPVMLEQGYEGQTQPTPVTCIQTCLAMILTEPVARVIEVLGAAPMNGRSLTHSLSSFAVRWNQYTHGDLIATGWYLLVVPSLNVVGGMHQIIAHYNESDFKFTVFDPSSKKRYKRDGSDLISWAELIHFIPGGLLK